MNTGNAKTFTKRRPILIMRKKRKPMSWFSHGYHGLRYCSWARTHDDDDDDDGGDGVAQHGGHTPKEVDRDIKPWFTVYLIDIGQKGYDQLTPVKTGYPLTSITWLYRGLQFTAHRGHLFFWSWPIAGFPIGSRAHVCLTYSKQGRIVLKNRIIIFSSIKMLKIQD